MEEVTSRQIMEAAAIGNIVTLTRWHQMGLIPPPEIRTHPNGRGKMAYWPEWVLEHCVRIRQLRKAGRTLSSIKRFLNDDWSQVAKEYDRRYRFVKASESMDHQAAVVNLRDAIEEVLRDWIGAQRTRLRRTNPLLVDQALIEQALVMLEDGFNPVLIIEDDELKLTADFVVSQILSRRRSMDYPVFVLPLAKELTSYFRGQRRFPDVVINSSAEEEQEFHCVSLNDGSFELERSERPPD